jgi:hypothetical protein
MTAPSKRRSAKPRDNDVPGFEPPYPRAIAALICVVAALTLLWPLLTGHILFGGQVSDMYIAGYSFRLFGAETFKQTGSIPQWNPYLLGGLPYIAAMHGDIFYPTAWLRWIMPVDLAITWGMVVHLVLAGWLTYLFARALGMTWGGAIVAGVSYELTGIVGSQMSPGHDGKWFASALTPLAFWLLLLAIRKEKLWAFGAFSFVVALSVLGHYHMSYFLLLALGLWALYLALWDTERPAAMEPWKPIAMAALAVVVGVGITSLQILPFLEYIKYSPRAEGGPNTGWAFATSFAFPPRELFTLILPEFNGILENYWGQNPLKFHTEYVGVLPLLLGIFAWADKGRRRIVATFALGAVVFLLFAFGGYSPLYRLAFHVLPYLDKIRAMGMVFFLPAFALAILAGFGMDALVRGHVGSKLALGVAAGVAVFALLGVVGGLQGLAEALAMPERTAAVEANAASLRSGAIRVFIFALLSMAAIWLIVGRRVSSLAATAIVAVVVVADLWSLDRQFYVFSPRANVLFRDDAITGYLKKTPLPYRVMNGGSYGPTSILMAYGIPDVFGYHGFELRAYDELADMEHDGQNALTQNFGKLLAVRFLIVPRPASIPGFHEVVPLTTTSYGSPGALYEADTIPPYARVVVVAAKMPDTVQPMMLADDRFPVEAAALFSDTSSLRPDSITQPIRRSAVVAQVTKWAPGAMTVALSGADSTDGHLLISENWYPDWHAEVDGRPGVVRRANHSVLSVDLPPGAKNVRLWFDSATYARGKIVSLIALIAALGLTLVPLANPFRDRGV